MKNLEIKRKLIAEALSLNVTEVTDEDIERLNEYITINKGTDGKDYYWYLDNDDNPKEAIATIKGEIIKVDDTEKFFNIK